MLPATLLFAVTTRAYTPPGCTADSTCMSDCVKRNEEIRSDWIYWNIAAQCVFLCYDDPCAADLSLKIAGVNANCSDEKTTYYATMNVSADFDTPLYDIVNTNSSGCVYSCGNCSMKENDPGYGPQGQYQGSFTSAIPNGREAIIDGDYIINEASLGEMASLGEHTWKVRMDFNNANYTVDLNFSLDTPFLEPMMMLEYPAHVHFECKEIPYKLVAPNSYSDYLNIQFTEDGQLPACLRDLSDRHQMELVGQTSFIEKRRWSAESNTGWKENSTLNEIIFQFKRRVPRSNPLIIPCTSSFGNVDCKLAQEGFNSPYYETPDSVFMRLTEPAPAQPKTSTSAPKQVQKLNVEAVVIICLSILVFILMSLLCWTRHQHKKETTASAGLKQTLLPENEA